MPIIELIVGLAVLGFVVWLITTKIAMPDWIKTTIQAIAVICVVLFLLQVFFPSVLAWKVPHF